MIQKKIHITWKTERIFDSKCFMVEHGLKKLIDLNPDWEVNFSNDDDIKGYLRENLSQGDFDLLSDRGIIEQADVWRLLKIYNEGGLYIDLDRFINIPLSEIIDDEIRWVLPTYRDIDFSQDFMCSESGNPTFHIGLSMNLHRRRMGARAVYFLGPQTWMNAVTYSMTGEMINNDPGLDVMNSLRKTINETSFIKTYKEEPWRNTIIFRAGSEFNDIDYESEKRKMYEEFGMDHWTGAYSK